MNEPVAWMDGQGNLYRYPDDADRGQTMRPLYFKQPKKEWVGLTDEEIAIVEDEYIVDYRIPAGSAWNFAKDIEAALKDKNT